VENPRPNHAHTTPRTRARRRHHGGPLATVTALTLAVIIGLAGAATPAHATTPTSFPTCIATTQHAVRPYLTGTTLTSQWKVSSPPADTTYTMSGVTSTAYPATVSPFALGTTTPGTRTCVTSGKVQGTVDPNQTWDYYHDTQNAACISITGIDWMQVRNLRCDSVEDGVKPKEAQPNQNVARFLIQGTYLTGIRDDCVENDFTVGGLIKDNLFEQCNTGISERPSSSNGTWTSPADETVTIDHTLIGLWQTPHQNGSAVVNGENGLFKWSTSANKLIIKCSTFKVDAFSLNGADAMALPAGTVVNDTACPGNPTTIVWTGPGPYPGDLRGQPVTVTSDPTVWTTAVANWKTAHHY
jgi:hypothetical protein